MIHTGLPRHSTTIFSPGRMPETSTSTAAPAALARPILVVCGALDDTAGRPEPLAAVFSDGRAAVIPNRDHMSAVGDRHTRQAVIDFFGP